MRSVIVLLLLGGAVLPCAGCGLKEIRSKSKVGAVFKHKGLDRTSSTQWSAQQGLAFTWQHGIKTGISYRRRDIDDGNGNNDNAVFVDVSFPIWKKAKKPSKTKKRLKKLKKRLAAVENELAALRRGVAVPTPPDHAAEASSGRPADLTTQRPRKN